MIDGISYDYSFMMSDAVGGAGTTDGELAALAPLVLEMRRNFFKNAEKKLGFMELPYDGEGMRVVVEMAVKYRKQFSTLIVLGIGGSDLGSRATIAALRSIYANFEEQNGMRVFFLGGNTDPQEIEETLAHIDLKDTALNVISKSGDTVETMSTFIYLRDALIKEVGYTQHAKHIIATTDVKSGTLRTIVDREGYDSLVVPGNVGGRFSVLSAVGLFPIACAGVDIGELLSGARVLCDEIASFSESSLHKTEIFAALHYVGLSVKKQNVNVFIPYAAHLREVGFWFRQLWAESLGKKRSNSGVSEYVGPTPVAALGATDQHSQFQLYYEGPLDKIITFVKVEDFGSDITVPDAYEDIDGIAYMKGRKFSDIINSELEGSSLALAERGRPNGTLVLPEISAFYVGQLFQFLEMATAYAGGLMGINTYDQPGVELGKHNAYALMRRKGFEQREKELETLMRKAHTRLA
jgi:glucose-6-phosphate isomerase